MIFIMKEILFLNLNYPLKTEKILFFFFPERMGDLQSVQENLRRPQNPHLRDDQRGQLRGESASVNGIVSDNRRFRRGDARDLLLRLQGG